MTIHIWEDKEQKKCTCGIITFNRLHQYGKDIAMCNQCLIEIKESVENFYKNRK